MVKKKRQTDPGDDCGESTESCEENINHNCLHINKAVCLPALRKSLKSHGLSVECSDCLKDPETPSSRQNEDISNKEEDSYLWMCLQCGTQLCSRSKNEHALKHFRKPHSDKHELAANTTNWQVYCYVCDRQIPCSSTKKLQEIVEFLKKQNISVNNRERDISIDEKVAEVSGAIPKNDFLANYSPVGNQSNSNGSSVNVCGLYNFGNTCFFNSVVQCLVQTPYLTSVLRQSSMGRSFKLEGGKLKIDENECELQPISGELESWGPLTLELTTTLEKLSSPGNNSVYKPHPLFHSLVNQFPQFGDGEQHDSHELLRQLLEGVRNEDLRRYQQAVLKKLDLNSKEKRNGLDNAKRQIVKFYGQKAAEKLLGPEQVFRGFLISTLECQECQHTSDRTENFLDLSLPVTAEKPQPPAVTRRKGIPEEQNCGGAADENKSKHQLKKEQLLSKKARKYRKAKYSSGEKQADNKHSGDTNENKVECKSSSEQSDADVEDNLEENTNNDDKSEDQPGARADTAANFALYHMESGYNSEKPVSSDSIRASPVDLDNKEKSDTSPERLDKEEPLCLSATAIPLGYTPLSGVDSSHLDSGVASPDAGKSDTPQATSKELGSPCSLSSEINMDMSSPRQDITPDNCENYICNVVEESCAVPMGDLTEAACSANDNVKLDKVIVKLDEFQLDKDAANKAGSTKHPPSLVLSVNEGPSMFDTPDYESSKWKKNSTYFPSTVSPRYQCDEGEYSVQSCLNQFTASELLAGNNKVGCEACTKRANSEKTIYTNATKRFLISSPPAVLILHLKRFQIGPRCMFRKISKHVSFPLELDIAPFCSEKIKSLPIVSPNQNKLLYSLYGVVEHSGSMHGGHYVAYVKVRPNVDPHDKRWSFLPSDVDKEEDVKKSPVNGTNGNGSDSSMSGYESGEGASGYTPPTPPGKWFYISDSRVQEVSQEKVLNTQAYLLFYERIM